MLEPVERRPVRLIGVSLTNLSGEDGRQLTLEELAENETAAAEVERKRLLDALQEHYHLDFAGHLEEIYHSETLHKTVEYMRKHM